MPPIRPMVRIGFPQAMAWVDEPSLKGVSICSMADTSANQL
jgi:hypothetical protein